MSQVRKGRFDVAGVILLAIALTAFALSASAGGTAAGLDNWTVVVIAVAAGGLFVVTEARASQPLVRLGAFRSPAFSARLVTNLLVSALMMTTLVIGPFYLMSGLGLDARLAGLVMAVGPAAAMVSGVPAGWLADRLGAAAASLAGLLQVMAGAFALALLPQGWGVVGYAVGLLILAPGYQLFLAANNAAAMAGSGQSERGAVSGLLNLSRNLGLIIGASVMGALYAALLDGGAELSEAVVAAASQTLAVAGLTIAAGLIIALAGAMAERRRM